MTKLLIVDDDKDTLEFLRDFFKPRGCVVFTASSGNKAIDLVKKNSPDVVVSDIKMEGMDGLQVLKKIKAFNKEIRVIMISVTSDDQTRLKAKKLGADDFFRKPLNTSSLEGSVIQQAARH